MYNVQVYRFGAWKSVHVVGNLHAAEVFAEKHAGHGSKVRVHDCSLDIVVFEMG